MKAFVIYPAGSLRSGADPSPNPYRDTARRMEIEIEDQGSEIGNLERCFRQMNRVDGSDLERYLGENKERSMCTGDMVEVNGTTYICHGVGWLKLVSGMGFLPMRG